MPNQQITTEQLQKETKALAMFRCGVVLSFTSTERTGHFWWAPNRYGDLSMDESHRLHRFLFDLGYQNASGERYTLVDVAAIAWDHLHPGEVPDVVVLHRDDITDAHELMRRVQMETGFTAAALERLDELVRLFATLLKEAHQ